MWSGVGLEKLVSSQLLYKFPEFQYRVRKRPQSVSNVSQINPFHSPVSLKIICTSSHLILGLRSVPAPTGLANKIQYVISLIPRTCHMICQSHCL